MNNEVKQNNSLSLMTQFNDQLENRKQEYAPLLPANCSIEKFMGIVKTAIADNQDLLKADRASLFLACRQCAAEGLFPDKNEAALIVYGDKVKYMPMIAGIKKRIRNSNEILSMAVNIVYEHDDFDYQLGDDEKITHKPFLGADRGKPIRVYAIVKTKDGGVYREVMSLEEIERIRRCSKTSSKGPWVDYWGEMARKTVLRRLYKMLPASSEIEHLIKNEDDMYNFKSDQKTENLIDTQEIDEINKNVPRETYEKN